MIMDLGYGWGFGDGGSVNLGFWLMIMVNRRRDDITIFTIVVLEWLKWWWWFNNSRPIIFVSFFARKLISYHSVVHIHNLTKIHNFIGNFFINNKKNKNSHAGDVASSAIAESTVASHCIFEALNWVPGRPAWQPAAWIHVEIPIPFSQPPCYYPQGFHCQNQILIFS